MIAVKTTGAVCGEVPTEFIFQLHIALYWIGMPWLLIYSELIFLHNTLTCKVFYVSTYVIKLYNIRGVRWLTLVQCDL